MSPQQTNLEPIVGKLINLSLASDKCQSPNRAATRGVDHDKAKTPCQSRRDPVLHLYSHIKYSQRLEKQRQTRTARAERKRRKELILSGTKSFEVDRHSGRWLSTDLNSDHQEQSLSTNNSYSGIRPNESAKNNGNILEFPQESEHSLFFDECQHSKEIIKSPDSQYSAFMPIKDRNAHSPNKNQIHIRSTETGASANRSKIHWNSVQPGRVTPARVPVITIDSQRLL
ncbi:uncharacterized protein LOC106068627 [Biomphalaria glabrata]|uniref:Uncharacterized protein LOC106068627 n=1 Tax=Biomphalaria glabrata TaxID=6526 RepID=A0A9W3A018_BIOGL|nr:uncharacterized protein LOC106068627 [Biomphalaria glabrata]XP_055880545.1 uncharacterized protein LOC106068627 [Biomphalaria glabrata]